MEQRTAEWFAARCGKVTASRVADVVAKTRTGYAASRANYMAELVCERLTGKPTEGFSNAAMQWGTDQEPFARDAYSARTGELVTEVGMDLLGAELAAKLSARAAQGVGAGLLTARLGLRTIEACRPLPWCGDEKPKLGELRKRLIGQLAGYLNRG